MCACIEGSAPFTLQEPMFDETQIMRTIQTKLYFTVEKENRFTYLEFDSTRRSRHDDDSLLTYAICWLKKWGHEPGIERKWIDSSPRKPEGRPSSWLMVHNNRSQLYSHAAVFSPSLTRSCREHLYMYRRHTGNYVQRCHE